jgi:hypothetical protein
MHPHCVQLKYHLYDSHNMFLVSDTERLNVPLQYWIAWWYFPPMNCWILTVIDTGLKVSKSLQARFAIYWHRSNVLLPFLYDTNSTIIASWREKEPDGVFFIIFKFHWWFIAEESWMRKYVRSTEISRREVTDGRTDERTQRQSLAQFTVLLNLQTVIAVMLSARRSVSDLLVTEI